jgi:hypothetical protein
MSLNLTLFVVVLFGTAIARLCCTAILKLALVQLAIAHLMVCLIITSTLVLALICSSVVVIGWCHWCHWCHRS